MLLTSILVSKKLKIKVYKIIILPVVLYGCETCSLAREHGLRVFENRVRRIFGPKGDKVTGDWRKSRNGAIPISRSKSRRMR
jgi:hypothetical protein